MGACNHFKTVRIFGAGRTDDHVIVEMSDVPDMNNPPWNGRPGRHAEWCSDCGMFTLVDDHGEGHSTYPARPLVD